MENDDVVVQAVKWLNKSPFGLTGIKTELEAHLQRRYSDSGCDECNRGYETCYDCDGDGRYNCGHCDGDGEVEIDHEMVTCDECDEGRIDCDNCEGTGRVNCEYCDGEYRSTGSGWSNYNCEQYLLAELVQYGLAEHDGEHYVTSGPLVYLCVYNDGSVDTECTFTISTENPESVLLKTKVIEVWNMMCEEITNESGTDVDVSGAGMHMALLNSEGASYPSRNTPDQDVMYQNFRKSMGLLIPALYFLASSSDKSRGMRYRIPQISTDKYSTIAYRSGSLEFRVFETCYQNPEQVLDNIVVMRNCMRFWSKKYVKNNLRKIVAGELFTFGADDGNELERFYRNPTQLDLLNGGIRMLKPSYYSVTELKKQRNFKVNKRYLATAKKRIERECVVSYKEYEQRYEWHKRTTIVDRQYRLMRDAETRDDLRALMSNQTELMARLRREAEAYALQNMEQKSSIRAYIEQEIKRYDTSCKGKYSIAVEG